MDLENFRPGAVIIVKSTRREYQAMAEDFDTSVARLYGRGAELGVEQVRTELETGEL